MKRNILILFAASLIIWSCGKRQEENEAFTSSAEDQAMAEGLWDYIGEQADGSTETVEEGESSWNNCATLTIDTAGNPFPLSVTVDFGDGCEGRDGRIRKGRLHYTLTNWMRFEGSSHLYARRILCRRLGRCGNTIGSESRRKQRRTFGV